jgi:protein-disulfide isomerase
MHQEEFQTLAFTANCVDLFLDMITQETRDKYIKHGDVLELKQEVVLTDEEKRQLASALTQFMPEETTNERRMAELYQLLLETQKEHANLQEKLLLILEQQKQDIKDLQQLLNNQPKQNNNQISLYVFCLLAVLVAVCYDCNIRKKEQLVSTYVIDY